MIELAWAERSDRGYSRRTNEDAVIAAPPVFAVADGMGGHAAGDVASTLAVHRLGELAGRDRVTRRETLETIRSADGDILERAVRDSLRGMGTTLTGLTVSGTDSGAETVVVFNVGDSRSYLLRNGEMTQVSRDHSVVQELIDNGTITPQQAQVHPERNVITRSLGADMPLEIDWWVLSPRVGDRFLLCSDGLFKDVTTSDIERILIEHHDPDAAADALVHSALAGGGTDNISVIVVDVVALGGSATADGDDDTVPGAEPNPDDTNPNALRPESGDTAEPVTLASSVAVDPTLVAVSDDATFTADAAGTDTGPWPGEGT